MTAVDLPPKALSLRTYRAATRFLEPVANFTLQRRLKAGKEDPARIDERRGKASRARPDGPLIWVHGASVGESLSILPLLNRLIADYPETNFLVTTGTITSAALMAKRLPPRCFHQYAPVDHPKFVASFFDHWRPDAGVFIESELWPSLIGQAQSRSIPLALVNGRLSPKSFKGWARRKGAARELLDAFEVILAQDKDNGDRLTALAGRPALTLGNLKRAAAPLPTDQAVIADLTAAIGDRNVWLAASTHAGEEEFVLDTHAQLKAHMPNILTVIAPRHPNRGDVVAAMLRERHLSFGRRTNSDPITDEMEIYLADTLGELGILYRLSDIAFIGGSLVNVGGHNPMEPARLGSAIVTGPHVFNFQETFESMREAGALALVRNERDLSVSLIRLLNDMLTREEMSNRAKKWADLGAVSVLNAIVDALQPVLEKGHARS